MQPIEMPKGAKLQMFMLFIYMVINFADKLVLQIAAVPIMTELHLSPEEYGAVGTAFFLCLTFSGLVVGFLANRFPTTLMITLMALSWAIVQFPMVGPVGFATIVACRMALGLGEGGAAWVATHALYKWYPDHKRAMPTAWLSQGSAVGVVIAAPALTWIVVHVSWHAAFGTMGVVGLIWTAAWLFIGKEGPLTDPVATPNVADRVPYSKLILSRTFIGCTLALFSAYWTLSLALTWFVPFMVKGLGFSQTVGGNLSILPWAVGAATVITGGFLSTFLVARGVPSKQARAILGTLPLAIGGVVMLFIPMGGSDWGEIVLLMIGTGLTGPIYVVCAPMLGEFVPDSQRAGVIATMGSLYVFAGVIAPSVMGYLVQHGATMLDGYNKGFQFAGLLQLVLGLIAMWLMAPAFDKARVLKLRALPAG